MEIRSCDNALSGSKGLRLFFHFMALLAVVLVGIMILSGCNKDGESGSNGANGEDVIITFVPNNGGAEITRTINGSIPTVSKSGYYLLGWYADAGLTVRVDFETIADIMGQENESKFTSEGYKLYAKWQELKEMTGVRIKDTFFIYDGKSHNPDIEGVPEGATVTYIGEGERIDAGKYEVTAVVKKEGYKDKELRGEVTIAKRIADTFGIRFDNLEVVWDGEEHSIEIEGELPEGIKVIYENNGKSEIGEYEVIARFDVGKNYESIAEKRAVLRIITGEYKIRLVEEDGSEREITVKAGENAEIPEPKGKRGYYGRWETENGEIAHWDSIHKDITVYARYEYIRYGIEYELNGGRIESYEEEYTVADRVVLPIPEREHWEFVGWYEEESLEGERKEEIIKGSIGDKRYYAKWQSKEYTVTFETNGGLNSTGNTTDGQKYVYTVESKDIELLSATKRGYNFICWKNEEGEEVREIKAEEGGSYTLYAEWEIVRYGISYELNGGQEGEANPREYTIEEERIELKSPTKEKNVFMGWYEDKECTGEEVKEIYGEECREIKLYAKWEKEKYTVEEKDGRVLITDYNYSYGEEVVIPCEVRGKKIEGIASGVLREARSVEIQAEWEELRGDEFAGCAALTAVILPTTLVSIPHGLLKDCMSLRYLEIPYAGDRRIGEEKSGTYYPVGILFGTEESEKGYGVQIRTVYESGGELKASEKYEAEKRYIPLSLKEIRVKGGEIAEFAFAEMKSLEKVEIEGETRSTGVGAFRDCVGLTRVTLPRGIQEVAVSTFYNCTGLKEILISEETDESILDEAIKKVGHAVNVVRYV